MMGMGERNAGIHSDGRQPAWKTIKMTTQKTKLTNFGNNYFFSSTFPFDYALQQRSFHLMTEDESKWAERWRDETDRRRSRTHSSGWLDAGWLEDVRWMVGTQLGWDRQNSFKIRHLFQYNDGFLLWFRVPSLSRLMFVCLLLFH